MRITFLLAKRVPDVLSPVVEEVSDLLTAAGYVVDGWIPEARLLRTDRFLPDADLYLLKSHTELALSLAGMLHDRGLPILNPYPACLRAQDKVRASQALRRAGVMTPETWLTGDLALTIPLLEEGPVMVKPHRGHRGIGVHVIHSAAQLRSLPPTPEPVIVQRVIPGPGEDLKVYVAGSHVYAVRKRFAADSFTLYGRPVPVTDAIIDLAQKVRTAFGLDLFGVDVIESPYGPVVVDVNYFPGYKGCQGQVAAQIASVIQEKTKIGLGAELTK